LPESQANENHERFKIKKVDVQLAPSETDPRCSEAPDPGQRLAVHMARQGERPRFRTYRPHHFFPQRLIILRDKEESSIHLNEVWTAIMVDEPMGCNKSALTEPLNRTTDINTVRSLLDSGGIAERN
jgi:hypothetical protein